MTKPAAVRELTMKVCALAASSEVEQLVFPSSRKMECLMPLDAKKAAGYFTDESVSTPEDLTKTQGRGLDDY